MMFKDYVVLITGAASGIGFETAKEFIEQGAHVVGVDFNEKTLHEAGNKLGDRFTAKLCDVTSENQIISLSKFVQDSFGRLDVLVNNAGSGRMVSIEEMKEEDFYRHYDILLKGPMLMVKHFVPLLRKSSNPNIINMSSTAARCVWWNNIMYIPAKAALETFTFHCVASFPGIRSNAILPGLIDTPFNDNIGLTGEEKKAFYDGFVKEKVPCGRIGKPEDIANGVLLLCSEKSSYINGTSLIIDGGFLCCRDGMKPSDAEKSAPSGIRVD